MLMDVLPGVFARRDPQTPAPVLFEIPRSGAEYPRDFRALAPLAGLQRSVSAHVETAYAGVVDAGATWLYALVPNLYIDLNRHELDIDPAQLDGPWPVPLQPGPKTSRGIGLIPTLCGAGQKLYDAPLPVAEVQKRLDRYYRPYHNEITRLLQSFHVRHGVAYHLSCHSMSGYEGDKRRSDFDLGDRNGTTCAPALTETVAQALRGFGYSVTINTHFIGAESVRKHAAPAEGIHSLQIEMNRSLYMDEQTRIPHANFDTIAGHLAEVARAIAALAPNPA